MRIDAVLEPVSADEQRRVKRASAKAPAAFRPRGRSRLGVALVDLSSLGCRIEIEDRILVGSFAWIILPTLESWYTRIAWVEGKTAGLDFDQPLHPAVADMIVRRAEAQGAPQVDTPSQPDFGPCASKP